MFKALLRQLSGSRSRSAPSLADALALADRGQLDDAAAALERLCASEPESFEARLAYGRILFHLKRYGPASAVLSQAADLDPSSTDARYLLGRALIENQELAAAAGALESVTAALPRWGRGWAALADAYVGLDRLDRAEETFLRAIEVEPGLHVAHYNYANLLLQTGRTDEAIERYRETLRLKPGFKGAQHNLLYALNFSDAYAPAAVFDEHREWARRNVDTLTAAAAPHPRGAAGKRPLRVGYVSPNFCDHAAAYFFEPVLRHHDPAAFEIHCYSDVRLPDATTRRLRSLGGVWHNVQDDSDEALAARIRRDGIDILVDLTGHTRGDRLETFAMRPAPLQITWNGYANTTGMPAMDYRLTDAYADPPGETDTLHSERLLRMPEIYMPFEPPLDAAEPGPLPALARGFVTFGSFNGLLKLSPRVLELWARVLATVPGARLMMLGIPEGRSRTRIEAIFQSHGIDLRRVDMHARVSHAEFMRLHRDADIALDSAPQAGTTTTAHSLYMGLPVVTLAGRVHAARVGVSMLSNVGLRELVAADGDDYVRIAAALARDLDALQEMRATLRERMLRSPNMDAPRFTRFLEQAYRRIWDDWCRHDTRDTQGPST